MPIRIYDDSSSEFAYSGSWSRTGTWSSSDGQRGTISVTSEQGASVSFTFPIPAVAFRIYGLKSSHGSYYGVCVDCNPTNPQYTFVSNYDATDNGTSPPVYFYHYSWPAPGIHQVTIVNQSDRRGIPAGTSVLALDRFELDVPVDSPISDPVSQSPSSASPSSAVQTPTSASASSGGGSTSSPPMTTKVVSQDGGFVTLVITQNATGASGVSTPAAIATSPPGASKSAPQSGLPLPSPSAATGDKPSGAAVGDDTGHSSKGASLGGIVGGIVGGLAAISLVIFLFLWLKKRKKRTSAATGVTPLEVPEMRTTVPDLANSGQIADYAEFRSEKGIRHRFEQSYSSYPTSSNIRANPATSNTALLNPSPTTPPASTLSYVSSQQPSDLSNEVSPTPEVRRVREVDAGPVPRDLQYDDNAETLPPEYGQVFSDRNRVSGSMRGVSDMSLGATASTEAASTFTLSPTQSSPSLQPVRRT